MTILKFKRKFKIKKIIKIKNEFLGLCQFGFYGIKALNAALITPNQIETSRRVIIRITKRVGKVYIRAVFHYAITAKSSGTRMGKGKGKFIGWVAYIKRGSIFIELWGLSKKIAMKAFNSIKYQLLIKLIFICIDMLN